MKTDSFFTLFGKKPAQDHVEEILMAADADNDGKTTKDELFTALRHDPLCANLTDIQLMREVVALFTVFDEDQKGYLDPETVQELHSHVHEIIHHRSSDLVTGALSAANKQNSTDRRSVRKFKTNHTDMGTGLPVFTTESVESVVVRKINVFVLAFCCFIKLW
jgi:hypothetical protein